MALASATLQAFSTLLKAPWRSYANSWKAALADFVVSDVAGRGAEFLDECFSLGYGLALPGSIAGSLAIIAELLVGRAYHLTDFIVGDVAGRGVEGLDDVF